MPGECSACKRIHVHTEKSEGFPPSGILRFFLYIFFLNIVCRMNKVRESSDEKNRRFSSSALRGAAVNRVPGVHGAPVLKKKDRRWRSFLHS